MTQEVLECLKETRTTDESTPSDKEPIPSEAAQEHVTQLPERDDKISETQEAACSEAAGREKQSGKRQEFARLREHLELLQAQAAQIPGFDLREALRDPAFVRLTAPGVGVSVADAWYALHREEEARRRDEEGRAALARAASVSARRPREGGGTGAALIASDYRSMSREEQLRVKKRIFEAGARGEKIYP